MKPKEFVDYVNTLPLTCEEKGHSKLCLCPSNPLRPQIEIDPNKYVMPTVTADDFREPGLTLVNFLKSVENEQDQEILKTFFYKWRW